MANKIIVMYTGNSCSKCKRAKENLENLPPHIKENLELIEKNVDENIEVMEFLKNELDSQTLPTFELLRDDDKPIVLRGFDENIGKIMEYLGL